MTTTLPRYLPLTRRSAGVSFAGCGKTPAERGANGQRKRRCAAFSFAEVMFAVVILGIGFILIAAIFPVAIQQTAATGDENNAAALARQAAAAISAIGTNTVTVVTAPGPPITTFTSQPGTIANPAYDPAYQRSTASPSAVNDCKSVMQYPLFAPTVKNYVLGSTGHNTSSNSTSPVSVPPPAILVPLLGAQWDLIKANAILPNDPRYAYAAFYKRENNSSVAELIVLATTVRNRTIYTATDDELTAIQSSPSVTATSGDFATYTTTTPLYTTICPDTLGAFGGAAEGSYLEILNTAAAPAPRARTYGLGRQVAGGSFEMLPGYTNALTAGANGLWGQPGRITDTTGVQQANLYRTSTLQATVAYCSTLWLPGTPSGRIFLTSVPGPFDPVNNPAPAAAVPGAFVIVADDWPVDPSAPNNTDYTLPPNQPGAFAVGSLNGRILRLGKVVTEDPSFGMTSGNLTKFPPGTFDLDPQYGMRQPTARPSDPPFSSDAVPNPAAYRGLNIGSPPLGNGFAKVYIIGAGKDPSTGAVAGTAQDIGIFATYFQVR